MAINKSNLFKNIIIGSWVAFLCVLIGLPLYVYSVDNNWFGLYGNIPSYQMLENPESDLGSQLLSSDGKLLGKYYYKNRVNASFDELSPNLVNALMAVEDARFMEHSGIDGESLLRVGIKSVLLGQNKGGGSTISQQLAKNIFDLRTDTTYEGSMAKIHPKISLLIDKTKEWILAVRLERYYTKKEILAMYLNTVEFGNTTFGIRVASKTYFGKAPAELNVPEAALLAGLPQNSSRLNPVRYPERAKTRRDVVIRQMEKYGFITTTTQADSLVNTSLGLKYNLESHNQGPAPYFRSAIKGFLHEWAKKNGVNLYRDGLRIYTTIDSRMQQYAEEVVFNHMKKLQTTFNKEWSGRNPWVDSNNNELEGFIEQEARRSEHYRSLVKRYGKSSDSIDIVMNTKRPMRIFSYGGEIDTLMTPMDSIRYYKRFLHTGFMAMDPYTGAIKAWVGGIDHKHFKFDHVIQGRRQPGSTFKPFVYATAIENGFSPCHKFLDAERSYPVGPNGQPWIPKNSDGKFSGEYLTLREAMAKSVNSVAVQVIDKVKPQTVAATAKRLGIKSELNEVLSLALGTSSVTVNEMIGAYSTFVNGGTHTEPFYITRIEDKNGNIIYQPQPKTTEALNEEVAYIMVQMLRGTVDIPGGTANSLNSFFKEVIEAGGKTGTTQNGSDGWFMGITPELVAGAWVGGDNTNIRFKNWYSGQGARTALPIWQNFMLKAYKDKELQLTQTSFEQPKQPVSIALDCMAPADSVSESAQPIVVPDGF